MNAAGVTVGVVSVGLVTTWAVEHVLPYWPLAVVVVVLAGLTKVAIWQRRRTGSAGLIKRWAEKARRNDGCASAWSMYRTCSRAAMRRKARVLRPSFQAFTWWELFRVPATWYATPMVRVGLARVWSPCEDVTLRFGGPRTGKTVELSGRILDAPGAVIATSTRQDIVWATGPARARRGPVYVFNPSGLGGLASTVTFNPLAGCKSPRTAVDRASDLLSGVSLSSGGNDDKRDFWTGQAKRALALLMHAAALGDKPMQTVARWIADPDGAALEVRAYLRRSPDPGWEADAQQFLTTNDTTRSSICVTITPALAWLVDVTASASAVGEGIDVERLLAEHGTVFLLGAKDGVTAPLVTAFTAHIAREARRLAELHGGRLEPPLTFVLDEAALICPIPLDDWTADMGGRNITIHIGAQSRAQLRKRWGPDGARAILNNSATLVVFGGAKDPEDLEVYSKLSGERDEPTRDPNGKVLSGPTRKVPVMTVSQIAALPDLTVMVIRRGMAPVVGRIPPTWTRTDVLRARGAWQPQRTLTIDSLTTADIPVPRLSTSSTVQEG